MRRVVCLHGFTGAPESWDEVVAALGTGVDVDRPHILGHDPDGAIDSATFEDEVDRLAQRWRGRGWRDLHLAGYSQGGRLALGLLARHRDLFSSATLIGASLGLRRKKDRRQRRDDDHQLARILEEKGIARFLEHWEAIHLFTSQLNLPWLKLQAQRELRLSHRPEGLARALRVLGLGSMPNYWTTLRKLDLPVHLMAGELDPKFSSISRQMAELLPRATVEIVPSAGHNLLLEAPASVARALLA